MKRTRICRACGKEFYLTRVDKLHCNATCKSNYSHKKKRLEKYQQRIKDDSSEGTLRLTEPMATHAGSSILNSAAGSASIEGVKLILDAFGVPISAESKQIQRLAQLINSNDQELSKDLKTIISELKKMNESDLDRIANSL